MSKKVTELHQKASEELARAAEHHEKAGRLHEVGRDAVALRHAEAARSLTVRAEAHAEKAFKAYMAYVELLMGEVRHRARNTLSLVQAIARQTATGDPETFIARFNERIRALASNQDLLTRTEGGGVMLSDLVRAQVRHLTGDTGSQIATRGVATMRLRPSAAEVIGLALHELATNASKYGALSTPTGHVDIGWVVRGDTFEMTWTEGKGPAVKPPEHRGFGITIITSLAKTIDGEVQLDFPRSGVTWRLTTPMANVVLSQDKATVGQKSN
jgi:two-component sensor histidine kinase